MVRVCEGGKRCQFSIKGYVISKFWGEIQEKFMYLREMKRKRYLGNADKDFGKRKIIKCIVMKNKHLKNNIKSYNFVMRKSV